MAVTDEDRTRIIVRRLHISAEVGDQALQPWVRGLGFGIQVSGLQLCRPVGNGLREEGRA